ncbi:barren [Aureobasidium pullulans]|uniref:Condensin complex subunit 2 n=1 Tax=Aureobasidium pullulans TaxID=5580 RepID=A0A4S8SY28_AURPU|nr:barren [Aureobasidium pullulans]THY88236.1 barren [Aureobasidium pullulans]
MTKDGTANDEAIRRNVAEYLSIGLLWRHTFDFRDATCGSLLEPRPPQFVVCLHRQRRSSLVTKHAYSVATIDARHSALPTQRTPGDLETIDMPRVRPSGAAANAPVTATPHKAGIKIPLNDDREEKAKRLQSRQAFHEMHMNSLKAAASPARKRKSLGPELADGPQTPSGNGTQEEGFHVGGSAVTPMKRVPILANFEEWMKMATDNKINATNSWNFALIDYFHDMSLLREGDGVNFQKASCTLDGCVKIYTSRVDSVATETGKLLSGLADSGNKKKRGDADDDENEDGEDEEAEDGTKKKTKKKSHRSEATLATSFAQLQLKKMELEFSVDPLFKKASADFDEGGAKGLLLNHLSIDNTGRIVFDSSDDAQDDDESRRDSMVEGEEEKLDDEEVKAAPPAPIDISGLAARFFPDLSKLDSQDICPSLKTFELGGGSASMDLPFLKAPEDWRTQKEEEDHDDARSGIVLGDDDAVGFDDDDGAFGGFDIPIDAGFGEGGEAWAKEAHVEPQLRPHDAGADVDAGVGVDAEGGEVGGFDSNGNQFGVTLAHRGDEHENILSYFDQALQKNWAGPEHWKIKKIKDAAKATPATTKKKEKEPFEIDFMSPMNQQLADLLYIPAPSNATISLPKKDWKSKTRNLLPDDKHFSSRDLLRLFLKPKARMGSRKSTQQTRGGVEQFQHGDVDEAYWANNQGLAEPQPIDEEGARGDYDANFFQDDGLGAAPGAADDDDDFADAQEMSPAADAFDAAQSGVPNDLPPSSQETAFGSNLITQSRRMRPEYVQYARVAKKVDVRRLKEEMWRGIGFEIEPTQTPSKAPPPPTVDITEEGTFKFTDVMNNLRHVYPQQQLSDISTSFGFICLLHLANEKGLVIENQEGFEELICRKDVSFNAADNV